MDFIPIPPGLQTRFCLIGENLLPQIPDLIRKTWPQDNLPLRLVADGNTWRVAGERLQAILAESGLSVDTPFLFPAEPPFHAEYPLVEALRGPLAGHRPVAVGAGTINDLVKRCTFELGLDGYLCCATAPSVDGYTSAGAAITKDGLKQTLPCPAPLVIAADTAILTTAPFPMTAAGYADLAAKIPAGGDWLIAEAVGLTPRESVSWQMVQGDLREWLEAPQSLREGNPRSLRKLFLGLCQTGFAMQHLLDSRPASGAEHLYSHCWEMRDIRKDGIQPSHGFKVAVGSLITTALMEAVYFQTSTEELRRLSEGVPLLTPEARAAQVREFLGGTPFEGSALKVSQEKLPQGESGKARRRRLLETHGALSRSLRTQLLPFRELRSRLRALGCPVSLPEIGLPDSDLRFTTYGAGMIRNRYTILDVLADLGLTDHFCQKALEAFRQP